MFGSPFRSTTLPATPVVACEEQLGLRRTMSMQLTRMASNGFAKRALTSSKMETNAIPKSTNPTLLADHLNSRFQLRNGMILSYACTGDKQGYPVVMMMGLGSHRYLVLVFEELARRNGLFLIMIDRPGLGLSTSISRQEWSALAWPDMVIELLDHLNVHTFSLIGQSCGAIYALATAYKYPSRIHGTIQLIAPWVPLRYTNSLEWIQRIPVAVLAIGNATKNAFQKASLITVSAGFMNSDLTWTFMSGFLGSVQPPKQHQQDKEKDQQQDKDKDQQLLLPLCVGRRERISYDSIRTDSRLNPKPTFIIHPLHTQIQQAACFENTNGCTLDLLVSLEKLAPIGFDYEDVTSPISCYWGRKDTIVPEASIFWMQEWMKNFRVEKLQEGNHGLVFRTDVMERVMQDLNREWLNPDVVADNEGDMMIDSRW